MYPGPPYYVPFYFLDHLLGALLTASALLLWIWKPVGWCLNIVVDAAVAAMIAYVAVALTLDKRVPFPSHLSVGAATLAAIVWFGLLAALLASPQSRSFFRVFAPSTVEPA